MSKYWDSAWREEVATWHEKKDTLRKVVKVRRKNYNKEIQPISIGDDMNERKPENKKGDKKMHHTESHHDCEDRRTCYDIPSCERNICRSFEVSVPVTITPYAIPGEPQVNCGGEVIITPCRKRCENRRRRHEFTITQMINVDIPIEFGTEVCYDETCIEDNGACDNPNFR